MRITALVCSGKRPPAAEPPPRCVDYFPSRLGNCYAYFIDESHVTVSQNGRQMYKGDRSRKETLVNLASDYPSSLMRNRP